MSVNDAFAEKPKATYKPIYRLTIYQLVTIIIINTTIIITTTVTVTISRIVFSH